jgi:L-ascorbate metabolism protein UlaG (beta-lactamase superfamily)
VVVERVHHWSTRWATDRNRALWSGFTVRLPGGNVFFAGDTGLGDGSWPREAARHGPFRLAILPIGAYLPRDVMMGSHVSPDETWRIFETLNPAAALGVHWGTVQLTFEAIDDPPRRIAALRTAHRVPPERFVVTEVGRTFSVPPLAAAR